MHVDDVNAGVVAAQLRRLDGRFGTKDVSSADDVLIAHGHLTTESNYHGTIGRWLSINSSWLGIRKDGGTGPRGQWWRRIGGPAGAAVDGLDVAPDQPFDLRPPAPRPVRRGHRDALRWMATPDFAEIVRLFDAEPEPGGVYLRLTAEGVQPVDLDASSRKPLIGVGQVVRTGTPPAKVGLEMAARLDDLSRKRATMAASPERQLEARLIRNASRARSSSARSAPVFNSSVGSGGPTIPGSTV